MEHGFLWLGSLATSYDAFLRGEDDPRRKDGKPSGLARRQDASRLDGVAFGYMQLPDKGRGRKEEYCAVGARRYPSDWIRCAHPVAIDMERHAGGVKAFSPAIRVIDDACAFDLLADLAAGNPEMLADLREIATEMGWADMPPWLAE
jgi:hypothetical protein